MSLRVVLYAEGGRELAGEQRWQLAPGDRLPEDALGAAHYVVARALNRTRHLPETAVLFEEPLRTNRGRPARGSDLLDRQTLRRLLMWPSAARRPQLAIVLVDADGDETRRPTLNAATENVTTPRVVAVAVQEVEAWLIADMNAVRIACGVDDFDSSETVEALRPATRSLNSNRRSRRAEPTSIGGASDALRSRERQISTSSPDGVLRSLRS
jgi:hypothetical protein